jgi:hypothetical protein
MEQVTPETPPSEAAEELWLCSRELWLQPVQWWTAWWNAWLTLSVPHYRTHSPATGHRFVVPDPIARAEEQDLFA